MIQTETPTRTGVRRVRNLLAATILLLTLITLTSCVSWYRLRMSSHRMDFSTVEPEVIIANADQLPPEETAYLFYPSLYWAKFDRGDTFFPALAIDGQQVEFRDGTFRWLHWSNTLWGDDNVAVILVPAGMRHVEVVYHIYWHDGNNREFINSYRPSFDFEFEGGRYYSFGHVEERNRVFFGPLYTLYPSLGNFDGPTVFIASQMEDELLAKEKEALYILSVNGEGEDPRYQHVGSY